VRRRRLISPAGVALSAVLCVLLLLIPGDEPARQPESAGVASTMSAARAFLLQGEHYYDRRQVGDLERARAAFEQALGLEPDYVDAWVALAGCFWLEGFADDQRRDVWHARSGAALRRALMINPAHGPAHARTAHLLMSHGDIASAERHYARAAEVADGHGLVQAALGGWALSRGKLGEAVSRVRRAVTLEPLSSVYRGNLIRMLLGAGHLDEAERELSAFLSLHPDRAGSLQLEKLRIALLREQYAAVILGVAELETEADRHALRAMALWQMGKREEGGQDLARLAGDYRLPSLVRELEARAYIGQKGAALALLYELQARAEKDQLSDEQLRWARLELFLSPFIDVSVRSQVTPPELRTREFLATVQR